MTVEEWKRKNPPIRRKPLTNADRIRQMTDEGLAYFLEHETHECPAPYYENHFDGCLLDDIPEESVTNTECDQCWLGWLKKESEREE